MDSYKEYVVRCKTSNDQIACFAAKYENLLLSMTPEQAFKELKIPNDSWRQLFNIIKNLKLRYRVSTDDVVFRKFKHRKSFIGYISDLNYSV